MIKSVTFDDTIPYAVDRRESRFHVDDGWTINEEAPGRVRLAREAISVIVQSMPYTLTVVDTPPTLADFVEAGTTPPPVKQQKSRGR